MLTALARPMFLPPGKGGLILILGGLAMLGLTVIWLLVRRPQPMPVVGGPRPPPHANLHHRPSDGKRPGASRASGRRSKGAAIPVAQAAAHVQARRATQSAPPPASAAQPASAAPPASAAQPASSARPAAAASWLVLHAEAAAPDAPGWASHLRSELEALGLGRVGLSAADDTRCELVLQRTHHGRTRGARARACRAARLEFQRAAQWVVRGAHVVELACGSRWRGPCRFEVRLTREAARA